MNKKSFTLIELLVVIVIIGILAGVIMISTSSSIDKANIAKLKVFEESVANDLAANMVSRWKLDEVNGTSTPDAWGSNTGTLYGTNGLPQLRSSSECVSDSCLLFDGLDDYIDCGNLDFNTGDFSISLWFNINNLNGSHMFFGNQINSANYRGFQISNYHANKLRFTGIDNTGVSFDINYDFNINKKWQFLTVFRNNSNFKMFLNGEVVGNDLKTIGNLTENKKFLIAARPNSLSMFHEGLIDDVKVYDTALSYSQIKQNYISGLNSLLGKGLISRGEYSQRIEGLSINKK